MIFSLVRSIKESLPEKGPKYGKMRVVLKNIIINLWPEWNIIGE